MKILAILVAICALSQTAVAQTPACKSIADSAQRLACYDKAAPPSASSAAVKPASSSAAKPPPPGAPKVDTAKYVDTISAEDAVMNARLKNICRGC
jgi:hypothetical protein